MAQWKRTSKKRRRTVAVTTSRSTPNALSTTDAQGRVHLQVHQDPNTGHPVVALSAPLFQEAWQNELTAAVANTALTTIQNQLNAETVVTVARNAMAALSRLADGLLSQSNARVACSAGCDHCCYQSVGATPAEALVIVDHLRRTHNEQELKAVTHHLAESRRRTAHLTAAERYSPEYPCPFLEDAQCTIYEVRPLSCRGMNALDAEECRSNLRDPEARSAFLASGKGGASFMEPIRAFHALSAGLQLSLAQLYHLDMRPLDLTAAVHELLTGPSSLVDEWLAGERALEPARGGDSSSNARVLEVSGTLPRS